MYSLRSRLAFAGALVAFISVLVTGSIAFTLVARYSRDESFRSLTRDANVIATQVDDPTGGGLGLGIARRLLRAEGDHVALIGPFGGVRPQGDPLGGRIALAVRGIRNRTNRGTVTVNGVDYAYAVVDVTRPNVSASVVIARPVSLAVQLLRAIIARVLLAGLLAIIAGVLTAFIVSRRLTRSMHELTEATASIASGNYDHRVGVHGNDDVADLAKRFNAMASSIEESRRRESELLANVSHELRTPITAIRGYAQALSDGTAQDAAEQERALSVIGFESARLERLVEDVIDLARAHDLRLEIELVDIVDVAREVAQSHDALARESGVTLSVSMNEPLMCRTDPIRVGQILSNLLDNALRVTPQGGTVRITGQKEPSAQVIEVSDTGPGISQSDLPHVFERGYLWKAYRGERPVGTGLGLAIVRSLVEALHGTIEVRSTPGAGTTFILRLSN
ncbi:MAG: sensor histidine kinase [Actinomycetota bacterium]